MITICFTYFKSLTLANLAAALYSLSRQDLSRVSEIVILDNDTADSQQDIRMVVDSFTFFVPVWLVSFKHGDSTLTHSWSTNRVVGRARTPWIFFTRADYLLEFNTIHRMVDIADDKVRGWDGFITGNVFHLTSDVAACEATAWRELGTSTLKSLGGFENDYTSIDSGVWLARRNAFNRVGGLDQKLTAWGHAQTEFQHRLFKSGVEFVRVPEAFLYHPQHAAVRDLDLAHRQLREQGIDIKDLWKRHDGVSPY